MTVVIGTLSGLCLFMFNKLDEAIKLLAGRMDAQASRVDQLYSMFVDLLKERKDK